MRRITANWITQLGALALLGAHFAGGGEATQWGPPVGTELAAALTAVTPSGATVSLRELTGEHGLVIAFVRSADWCRFCKRQLLDLSAHAALFEQRGLRLIALSYDSPETLADFTQEHDIRITLLADEQSRIIDAFGIRNDSYKEGSSGYGVPHPGVVVYDNSGRLIAKFAEHSYRKRPPVTDMLNAIDAALR